MMRKRRMVTRMRQALAVVRAKAGLNVQEAELLDCFANLGSIPGVLMIPHSSEFILFVNGA